MITRDLDQRFRNGAEKYAAYLETPEGRLRTDLAFANLQDFLPSSRSDGPMHVLDVGCGTGAIGVRLARLGCWVTLLDSSPAMLEIARHAADEAGVAERATIHQGEVSELVESFTASFDVVVCHNVLEFVQDPGAVLLGCARAMRDGSAILSIVVRSQPGEVLKAALSAGDLTAAEANLTAEWGYDSLYGEKVRLFTTEGLLATLKANSLEPLAERGLRVVADYLPTSISRADEYERILELEKKLGRRPEFARVARYVQVLARRREEGS